MAKRRRMSRGRSRKSFNRGTRVHAKNGMGRGMRGGIRL